VDSFRVEVANDCSPDRSPDRWLASVQQQRLIAVIRADSLALGLRLARLAIAAGVGQIEIGWNSAGAAQLVHQLRGEFPDRWIGAGTVLSRSAAEAAIAAGAQFLFSPHTDPVVMAVARSAQVAIVPGALTPTEIMQAWTAGATAVKVFPIAAVGGAAYLQALRSPLPQIPLIPTGGVTLENVQGLLAAGAIGVGVGSQLFPAEWVRQQHWGAIQAHIQEWL